MFYPEEILDSGSDNGTMPENVAALTDAVVGHRIVSAQKEQGRFIITLDTGDKVELRDTDDCCACTYLDSFFLDPSLVDHAILGVGTTDGYTTWHIYADFGDIMRLEVGWSCGNPFYYGYGFDIQVSPADLPSWWSGITSFLSN